MNIDHIKKKLDLNISKVLTKVEGGNSTILKVETSTGSFVAIKLYKGLPDRINRMLNRELSAIRFLKTHNFRNIPEILEVQNDLGLIIFKWIDGEIPKADLASMESIINMCLDLYNLEKDGVYFENAVDSVFSIKEINDQVQERIYELSNLYISSIFDLLHLTLNAKLNQYKNAFVQNQIFSGTTLNISDLGTHNMLLENDSFSFVDFEFFGRDSIDKMVGDFLLHPRNEFNSDLILNFINTISDKLSWNRTNLEALLPILSLKWALIAFKRTLKEINIENSNSENMALIDNSVGMKYLEYFEILLSSKSTGPISTFYQFTGRV